MKKLFSILIALALLAGVSTMAFAAEGTISYGNNMSLGSLRTIVIYNNSSATVATPVGIADTTYATSGLPEPGVIPGKVKILGYDFTVTAAASDNAGAWVALIDAPNWVSGGNGDIFAEAEATPASPFSKIFPMGMNLKYRLIVEQGPYSVVTVYYVQDLP